MKKRFLSCELSGTSRQVEQKDKSGIQKDIDRLERHLFDSLSIERFIKGDRALDIGSGGASGIPLAIVGLICTLLCSIGRQRVRFLG